MVCMDEEEAVGEVMAFKLAGGNSVVEMSNIGLGRSAKARARISRKTGLPIIMGSGYYFDQSVPADMKEKSEEQITEEVVKDIKDRVGTTRMYAGFIGEI